jgi:hypothetical protein
MANRPAKGKPKYPPCRVVFKSERRLLCRTKGDGQSKDRNLAENNGFGFWIGGVTEAIWQLILTGFYRYLDSCFPALIIIGGIDAPLLNSTTANAIRF